MTQKSHLFRKATGHEISSIINHVYEYFGIEAKQYFQQFCFWIKQGKINEVFALKENLEQLLEKIPLKVYSAGTPVGTLWGEEFQLEVEGSAFLLSITKKKIIVKTEQFLYGKHVYVENVELSQSDFSKGDMVLLLGKDSLHYGIGKVEISSEEIQNAPANTILIKGSLSKPLDRGWYLRKGN